MNAFNFKKVLEVFGFVTIDDFVTSLYHKQYLFVFVSLSSIVSTLGMYIGLNYITTISLLFLIIIELSSGIVASLSRKEAIESWKFSRFGFKIFCWFSLLFILNSFMQNFKDSDIMMEIYKWIYNFIFLFISLEYLISIMENIGILTAKESKSLLSIIKNKIKGTSKPEELDFFESDFDLMSVLDNDLNFKKVNTQWVYEFGFSKIDFTNLNLKDLIKEADRKYISQIKEMKQNTTITLYIHLKTNKGHYNACEFNITKLNNNNYYNFIGKMVI